MHPVLFIADLHLTPDRPHINAAFFAFLEQEAAQASGLYILGDLFEAWVGDDDLTTPLHAEVASALKRQADRGLSIHIMHGNRDFLLAGDFCTASGSRLIPDPSRINLNGTPTLLTHGDTLCTDDTAYLAFRRQVHDPAWQAVFLARPLAERHALARDLRAQSEQIKADKTPEIMDVNAAAVTAALQTHACTRLIHGHTHRPGHHIEPGGERWVLPAWYDGAGWLRCAAEGCQLFLP